MSTYPAGYWVTRGAFSGSVSFTVRTLCQSTVPRPYRSGFIRSRLLSSSKCLRSSSRSPLVRTTTPAWVPALFAASPTASTCAGSPTSPLRSARGFSQPSGGFLRHRLCGLVSSRSHVQGSAVQGFLPIRSGSRLVAESCPRAVRTCVLTGDPVATRTPPTSRLRSAYRCVPRGRGLAFPPVAPLFGFLLLQAPGPPP